MINWRVGRRRNPGVRRNRLSRVSYSTKNLPHGGKIERFAQEAK